MTLTGTGLLDDYRIDVAGVLETQKLHQTIDFAATDSQAVTGTVHLAATASSGLSVHFALAEGPALMENGTNMTFTGSGYVGVVATQPGNQDWHPAHPVTNTFAVLTTEGFVDSNGNGVCDEWEAFHFGDDPPPESVIKRRAVMSLRHVFVAGLNPHDDSVLEILGAAFLEDESGWTLLFPAATNRLYDLLGSGGLTNANGWDVVIENIAPTGTPWQVEVVDPPDPPRFYRLRVRLR